MQDSWWWSSRRAGSNLGQGITLSLLMTTSFSGRSHMTARKWSFCYFMYSLLLSKYLKSNTHCMINFANVQSVKNILKAGGNFEIFLDLISLKKQIDEKGPLAFPFTRAGGN